MKLDKIFLKNNSRFSNLLTNWANQRNYEVEEFTEKKEDPEAGRKLDVKLQCDVLAETVVIGWGAGIREDGEPLEYTIERCAALLNEYDDLRVDVVEFARNKANYPPKMNLDKVKKK